VHRDLAEAIDFHHAIIAEGSKALVGYDTAKALNVTIHVTAQQQRHAITRSPIERTGR
jgi:hypothetical protein